MDLDLSAEHQLLRSTIRDFMDKEVAPVVEEHEREHKFPVEVVRRLGEMGWLGIPIPEDEGGAGMDTLAYAIAVEEIGRVWGSLGLIVAAHTSLGCGPLHLAGTKEQKDRYLVPMASGQVIGAYGLTEPGAGSDAGGTRTTARLEGDDDGAGGEWVIDGSKRFITNAGQAGTYIITAKTGTKDDGGAEISAFILPADTPGFRVVRIEDKLGLHASATGELAFDRCRIPADNLLGERGDGFRTFLKILDGGRISIAALALGIAQARVRRRRAVRPDAAAVRQADRQLPGRRVHDRGHGDGDRGRPRRSSGSPPGSRTRVATTRSSPPRRSCSRPRSARGSRTPRSRSTAATATSPSTRSSASCATPSSPRSARGRARSSAW